MSVVDPMTPVLPPSRFTLYYYTMDTSQPWCQYMAPAPQWPSDLSWRLKAIHTTEIQSKFTQW